MIYILHLLPCVHLCCLINYPGHTNWPTKQSMSLCVSVKYLHMKYQLVCLVDSVVSPESSPEDHNIVVRDERMRKMEKKINLFETWLTDRIYMRLNSL